MMRRAIVLVSVVAGLTLGGCTTAVTVKPPRTGMVRVEGRWVTPPRADAVWVPGHVVSRGAYRVWVPGHWR